jgi:PAS domain S-box-containing protein
LLDIQLKDGSGLEYLIKNKQEIIVTKKIPTIMISGNINSQVMRDSLKAGAVDVIKKPYVIEEIILKVDMWVEYKRKELENKCSNMLLEQYKNTVDMSSIVSKTDKRGRITYVNEQFCKISGFSEDELLGKNHNLVRHPDMDSTTFKELWSTIKNKKEPWTGKVKNKKKDGGFYWVDTIINPIIDPSGNIIEFIAIRKDITEQVLIEEYFKNELTTSNHSLNQALKLSKQYELAINESNILSRANLKGTITYVNDKFCEITGYTREEVIGRYHNIVKHPDTPDSVFHELWKTIKNGETWKGILKNKAKDGKPYWVDTTIVPIKDQNNKIIEFMAIRHDLTELFELHKEIEDTQKEVIYKMGEIGETRSKETGNHVKRVAEYSRILANLYGLSEHEANILFTASPMHDIGKVGIPDSILKKPGRLTEEEFTEMKLHSEIGYNILKGSNCQVQR